MKRTKITRTVAFSVLAALLPGAFAVYLAFHGGGYFAGTQGWLAALIALLLLLRATLADDPFGGTSRLGAVAVGALVLLAAWILLSANWSHAPGRALLEFDRALLYGLAAIFFTTMPMSTAWLRRLLQAVAVATVLVCAVALITRVLPDLWPVTPNIANERLSYPITYWNTLGLLGALGAVLCLHFTCSERESRPVRVAGAAALPLLSATVYLTFSRGAIAGGAIGLLLYLAVARPKAVVGGLLAAIPPSAIATLVTYHANRLATRHPTTPEAISQGHRIALAVALCVVGGAGVRIALLRLDRWVVEHPRRRLSRRMAASGAAVLLAAAAVGLVAVDAPAYISRQYDHFVHREQPHTGGDLRNRLTDPSANGRIQHWQVAMRGWRQNRLHGSGAGTYQNLWDRYRPELFNVFDGHSLYAETLGELGIVGLVLVLALVGCLLVGGLIRVRGPDRALFAAALVFVLVWALRAGIDWDWEMPVVTLTTLAVGAAVLATPSQRRPDGAERVPARVSQPPPLLRLLIGVGCLLVAITPVRVALSQERLNAAVSSYRHGKDAMAVDEALGSLDVEPVRPEPRLVLAYADLRLGQPRLAVNEGEQAVANDPRNWQLRYLLGLSRALAGLDPRQELRQAARLNPREPIAKIGLRRFAGARTPHQWKARAHQAPLPRL